MRRAMLAAGVVAILAGPAAAKRRPPPPPVKPAAAPTIAPWAAACGQALTTASTQVGKRHRGFRGVHADALAPIDLPSRATTPGAKPLPPVKRYGSSAHWSLQLTAVPEYFYVDVVDLRDDPGDWAAIAGDATWACRAVARGKQRNVDCVMRLGDRLAIVRAIHWRRSPRVTAYLPAFQAAAATCLR